VDVEESLNAKGDVREIGVTFGSSFLEHREVEFCVCGMPPRWCAFPRILSPDLRGNVHAPTQSPPIGVRGPYRGATSFCTETARTCWRPPIGRSLMHEALLKPCTPTLDFATIDSDEPLTPSKS
jgi:hypothetical protein